MNPVPKSGAVFTVEPFITKEAVAERLGAHPDRVSKMAAGGELPFYRIGRRLRFKWSEVERHLAQRNHVPANFANGGQRP